MIFSTHPLVRDTLPGSATCREPVTTEISRDAMPDTRSCHCTANSTSRRFALLVFFSHRLIFRLSHVAHCSRLWNPNLFWPYCCSVFHAMFAPTLLLRTKPKCVAAWSDYMVDNSRGLRLLTGLFSHRYAVVFQEGVISKGLRRHNLRRAAS